MLQFMIGVAIALIMMLMIGKSRVLASPCLQCHDRKIGDKYQDHIEIDGQQVKSVCRNEDGSLRGDIISECSGMTWCYVQANVTLSQDSIRTEDSEYGCQQQKTIDGCESKESSLRCECDVGYFCAMDDAEHYLPAIGTTSTTTSTTTKKPDKNGHEAMDDDKPPNPMINPKFHDYLELPVEDCTVGKKMQPTVLFLSLLVLAIFM